MIRSTKWWCLSVVLSIGMSVANAQDPPAPDGAAISVNQYSEVPMQVEATGSRTKTSAARAIAPQSYYSPNLKAHFKAEWMFVVQKGKRFDFWGARIHSMDPHSPLRELRVNPGDVITRLDGIPVWTNMFKEQGRPWQLVQLEEHYGRTEVRFILRGTNQVRLGDMMLDGSFDEEFEDAIPVRP